MTHWQQLFYSLTTAVLLTGSSCLFYSLTAAVRLTGSSCSTHWQHLLDSLAAAVRLTISICLTHCRQLLDSLAAAARLTGSSCLTRDSSRRRSSWGSPPSSSRPPRHSTPRLIHSSCRPCSSHRSSTCRRSSCSASKRTIVHTHVARPTRNSSVTWLLAEAPNKTKLLDFSLTDTYMYMYYTST